MPSLSQCIERNRTHSEHSYVLLAKLILPDGEEIRLARNPHSLVYPSALGSQAVFETGGDKLSITNTDAAYVEFSVTGEFDGTLVFQQLVDGAWYTIETIVSATSSTYGATANTQYRLIAVFINESTPHCALSEKGGTWQAVDFLPGDIEESDSYETRGLSLSIGNGGGVMQPYLEQLDAWRKLHGNEFVQIRLLVVNTGLLDDPEPVGEWHFIDDGISLPAPMDKCEIKLGIDDVGTAPIPARAINRDFCHWRTAEQCQYYALCNHTLAMCRADYNRSEYIGAFPTVEQGGVYG
ncbi:MAG: hypothetical protein ACERJ1_17955 [Halodesulfovibrio sp.]|uniref:hypothetical protein n=1 Tax=Halodesulfovibrio sp. TaxID=1912772 RepID=UPI00359EB6BC